jgi:hypothetical protein
LIYVFCIPTPHNFAIDIEKEIKLINHKQIKIMKKNLLSVIALVLVTFGSISAQSDFSNLGANTNQKFTIQQLDNLRFKVIFSEKLSGKIYLKITDESGNALVNENLNMDVVKPRLYDMSNLVDGKYVFTVEKDKKITSQTVILKTNINRSALMALN